MPSTRRPSSPLLLSLEILFIVNVSKAIFRERINRFTLFLPAFCSRLLIVLIPRKGQVGGDTVSDSVAHHVVTVAVCADQLSPVKRGDEQMHDNIAASCLNVLVHL